MYSVVFRHRCVVPVTLMSDATGSELAASVRYLAELSSGEEMLPGDLVVLSTVEVYEYDPDSAAVEGLKQLPIQGLVPSW
jgi:hypothetical protein